MWPVIQEQIVPTMSTAQFVAREEALALQLISLEAALVQVSVTATATAE
jgi:hypothetical protein